jgi:HK97 family phage portal protein
MASKPTKTTRGMELVYHQEGGQGLPGPIPIDLSNVGSANRYNVGAGGGVSFGQRVKIAIKALQGVGSPSALSAANGMISGIFSSPFSEPPLRSAADFLEAYNSMPWLRAVASKIADGVAAQEWHLYVARTSQTQSQAWAPSSSSPRYRRAYRIQRASEVARRKYIRQLKQAGELEVIEDHPFLDLMDSANSYHPGLVTRQLTQVHIDLLGEGYWILERNEFGMPVTTWSLPPSWVSRIPTPSDPTYEVRFRGWEGSIPQTEIIRFNKPNPQNPYGRGSGTARSLADELETDEFAAKHTRAFFYNRAKPDLLIFGDGLQKTNTERLEQDWLAKNQGFWKAFKPYFINKKVEVKELTQNFQHLQLVELRKHERDTIVQVFGVPPEILGVIENSNRATIEAADYLFARWVITPRLEFIRTVLQQYLIPEFDDRLILDYESPIHEDREMILKMARAAPWSLNVDEWRDLMGREPLPDNKGKVHVIPLNMVVTETLEDGLNDPNADTQDNPDGNQSGNNDGGSNPPDSNAGNDSGDGSGDSSQDNQQNSLPGRRRVLGIF